MTADSSGGRYGMSTPAGPFGDGVPEVQLTRGITISYAAAVALVGVIDALAVKCAPYVPDRQIVALRHQLIECLTYAGASARVSAKAFDREHVLALPLDAVMDTKVAARRIGITDAGVRYLCREERLVAKQDSGGRWWIDQESLDRYIEERGH